MEALSLSAPLCTRTNGVPFSVTVLGKRYVPKTSAIRAGATPVSVSLKESGNSANPSSLSTNLRRPNQSLKTSIPSSQSQPTPRVPANPLKNPISSAHVLTDADRSHSLANKFWLSSKLSPPSPPADTCEENEIESRENGEIGVDNPPDVHFRQEGKIFVGNLPNWIKKNDVAEFFQQFGPIKNVILIKGHNDTERNAGFGFVIYGGPTAAKSAMNAEEFDGVEFHGRVLTVKLDDGRRLKEKTLERVRWVEGEDKVEYRSKWHEERDRSREDFRKVIETEPENWQAVVRSFENIKKVELLDALN